VLETRINIKKTALLIIDMQNDVIKATDEPYSNLVKMVREKGVIRNTARVLEAMRRLKLPVIFIGHVHRKDRADFVSLVSDLILEGKAGPVREVNVEGTSGAQIVDELKPMPGEYIIWKRRSNAFYCTDLELVLRARGIDTVVLGGIATDVCVANTARGAQERDIRVIILSDCVAAMMPEDDEYFLKRVFPALGRVRTSDEIISVLGGS
jgi:nicotinamidase-related amidase